uniref:Uncharacterized protein n=1 Tax=Panagrellus redivivus TaxID=6233 RepID=A0A7E4W734_PANRE
METRDLWCALRRWLGWEEKPSGGRIVETVVSIAARLTRLQVPQHPADRCRSTEEAGEAQSFQTARVLQHHRTTTSTIIVVFPPPVCLRNDMTLTICAEGASLLTTQSSESAALLTARSDGNSWDGWRCSLPFERSFHEVLALGRAGSLLTMLLATDIGDARR